MTMQIDYRSQTWLIDGNEVQWVEDIGNGVAGWRCPCWHKGTLIAGGKHACRHTVYVEDCETHKRLVHESGARVVGLRNG